MNILKTFLLFFVSLLFFTACKSYNIEVDLTPEEIQAIKTEIADLKEQIANYDGEENTIPNLEIVQLSRDYEKLGDIDMAIKVYKDILDAGLKTRAIIHNLGRLYEKVGEYKTAITYYTRLLDEYGDVQYHYDITKVYIMMKDIKNAEKHFNEWQRANNTTDPQIQQEIKDLREEAKES